ncbi:MAG: hypothetical protein V3W31_03110 [Thermodesulfobacteriota bacterium]
MEKLMDNVLGPRTVGPLLTETFRVYGRHFLKFVAIAAVVEAVCYIPEIVFGTPGYDPETFDPETVDMVPWDISFAASMLGFTVINSLMDGVFIHAVSEHYTGGDVSVERAYHFVLKRMKALVGAAILFWLPIAAIGVSVLGAPNSAGRGSFTLLIVFPIAMYLMVRWAFIYQAATLEGCEPMDALRRSGKLVDGDWWRVLGVMVVMFAITYPVSYALTKISAVGTVLAGVILPPIFAIMMILLYYDLRVRKEGYTVEKLSEELRAHTTLPETPATPDGGFGGVPGEDKGSE